MDDPAKVLNTFLERREFNKRQPPINALPEPFQEYITHCSEVGQYPREFLMCSVLVAIATATGRSHILKYGPYDVITALWIVIVGMPGINKSTPVDHGLFPLKATQKKYYEQFNKEMSEPREEGGPDPVLKKILVGDHTLEAMVRIQQDNHKVVLYQDELGGWIASFNKYNKGSGDIQTYLSLFNGGSISRDTLKSFSGFVEKTFLSVIGTIQPSVFSKLFTPKDGSGFTDRFLICFPQNIIKPYPELNYFNPAIEARYQALIDRLIDLDFIGCELTYTPEAYKIIQQWSRSATDRQNGSDNETERSILAKMEIYIHRFALVLQMAYFACDNGLPPQYVGVQAAEGAVLLADYFTAQAEDLRIKHRSELLPQEWKKLYEALPDEEFPTKVFVEMATLYCEVSDRTAKQWLKKHSEGADPSRLFNRLRQGKYIKA